MNVLQNIISDRYLCHIIQIQQFQGLTSEAALSCLKDDREKLVSLRGSLGKARITVRLCHMDQLWTDAVLRDLGKSSMNYILKLTVQLYVFLAGKRKWVCMAGVPAVFGWAQLEGFWVVSVQKGEGYGELATSQSAVSLTRVPFLNLQKTAVTWRMNEAYSIIFGGLREENVCIHYCLRVWIIYLIYLIFINIYSGIYILYIHII